VLIETILASFEMDEILYELRDHSAGLNCGRWDYIFSFIKKLRRQPPDAAARPRPGHHDHALHAQLLAAVHQDLPPPQRLRHGRHVRAHPIKNDPVANEKAIAGVRADKEREATDGHDGTWVAHPGLVPIALEVFDRMMPQPNQISEAAARLHLHRRRPARHPHRHHHRSRPPSRTSPSASAIWKAWLRGIGCVPLFNLMEDAATAEISRAQLWQWVHHGRGVSYSLFENTCNEKGRHIAGHFRCDYLQAAKLVSNQ
jgi:malate synthase